MVQQQKIVMLQQAIKMLLKKSFANGFNLYFDIEAWLESKVGGKPLAVVLSPWGQVSRPVSNRYFMPLLVFHL